METDKIVLAEFLSPTEEKNHTSFSTPLILPKEKNELSISLSKSKLAKSQNMENY